MLRLLQVPAPAAGADWTFTLPAAGYWRIRSVFATLTASATVANRQPGLAITDGTVLWHRARPGAVLIANGVADVLAMPGLGFQTQGATQGTFTLPIPDVVMPPGFVISSVSTALQAGDQYSSIVIAAEEHDFWPVAITGSEPPPMNHLLHPGGR